MVRVARESCLELVRALRVLARVRERGEGALAQAVELLAQELDLVRLGAREVDELAPHRDGAHALRRLRDQVETNLSGLLGPSVAHQIVDDHLPFLAEHTSKVVHWLAYVGGDAQFDRALCRRFLEATGRLAAVSGLFSRELLLVRAVDGGRERRPLEPRDGEGVRGGGRRARRARRLRGSARRRRRRETRRRAGRHGNRGRGGGRDHGEQRARGRWW